MKHLLWTAAGLNLVMIAWTAGQLPDPVASHFGADNAADGFSSRAGFVIFLVVLVVAVTALFAGLAHLIRGPLSLSLINMPNKQRWIDAGRECELRAGLSDDLQVIGAATLALFLPMQGLTVLANRQDPPALSDWVWAVVFGYVVAVLAYSIYIGLVKYRHPG